ncbi:M15 family metallopeptidase [Rhizobium alvei]|uniref:M15 family metallopeptidase n=1 Tax=Rhizobium alvei TaxID=1132659 RepID=A0ABT8YHR4_9HYPH|nr:M15 family metallopeptidase [Rhizobium alvei]MDO6963198.1 M15 family metallopeptidase [Rhizobium alvei]
MNKGLAALALLAAVASPAAALTLDEKIGILRDAYPDTIAAVADGKIRMKSGAEIIIDDGKVRDHFQKLEQGDIEDSLQQTYPAGACETRPEVNFDPGRIRSEALMRAMYGDSAKVVKAELSPVEWFGETLRVTKVNGVDKALGKVRDELAAHAELKRYLAPSAGVFNWRKVSGQTNLSVHSFGAAIDINTKFADYWIWSGGKPGHVPKYANKYPMQIIDIFERHGFIWGGRWYHYDTMHFEYRPELIEIGRREGVSACK